MLDFGGIGNGGNTNTTTNPSLQLGSTPMFGAGPTQTQAQPISPYVTSPTVPNNSYSNPALQYSGTPQLGAYTPSAPPASTSTASTVDSGLPPYSAPGGSRTSTAQSGAPATTTPASTSNSGLRDMSGQTYAGVVIPQGWSMDGQGNWVNTNTAGSATSPTAGSATNWNGLGAPNDVMYNPDGTIYTPTTANNGATPFGVSRLTPEQGAQQQAANWQNIYGSGTAPAGSLNGITNGVFTGNTPAMAPPLQASPAQTGSSQNNNYLMQLLQGLFGSNQPQYNTVKTPLGYTQYQQTVPTQSQSGIDPLTQMILRQLLGGQNSQGGSQGSFWNLLSGGVGTGGNSSIDPSNLPTFQQGYNQTGSQAAQFANSPQQQQNPLLQLLGNYSNPGIASY